jgi:hypothetical protein|tara:strand:- start:383 stop:754 length:372 start_codon:yes stop_codon:yes gene_type:complete
MRPRFEPDELRFFNAVNVTDDKFFLMAICIECLNDDQALTETEREDVFGANRRQLITDRRHILMTLCMKYGSPVTLTSLAKMFKKHHATLINARNKCAMLIYNDRYFTKTWKNYERKFIESIQ